MYSNCFKWNFVLRYVCVYYRGIAFEIARYNSVNIDVPLCMGVSKGRDTNLMYQGYN